MSEPNPTNKFTDGEISAATKLAAEMGYSPGECVLLHDALAGNATAEELQAQLSRYTDAMFGRVGAGEVRLADVRRVERMIPASTVELDLCDALGLELPVPWDDALALVRMGAGQRHDLSRDLDLAEQRAERLHKRASELELVVPLASSLAAMVVRAFDLAVAAKLGAESRTERGVDSVTISTDAIVFAQEIADLIGQSAAMAVAAMSAETRASYERVRERLELATPASSSAPAATNEHEDGCTCTRCRSDRARIRSKWAPGERGNQ